MNIRISADSTCDLSPELIEKYAPGQGLEVVYLNVFGDGDGK